MKLLVDNRWAGNTGIGRVYAEVISRTPSDISVEFLKNDLGLGSPLNPLFLYKEIIGHDVHKFYSPSFMPPYLSKVPFIITIHDLNHLYFYSKFHKYYFKNIIGPLARRANKIITVSEFTKTELIEKLKISEKRIEVVYNGIDDKFLSNEYSYKGTDPYFLYVGNRRSYKNLERMLASFSISKIAKDFKLYLSGHNDSLTNAMIIKYNLNDRIKFLGFINETDLPMIYKGAYALLFVSMMEGFGLPILEAMASGTPVITSNISALPEVAGGAALTVNPYDKEEIANAIEILVDGSDFYAKLVERGYERCKFFNWQESAILSWNIIRG